MCVYVEIEHTIKIMHKLNFFFTVDLLSVGRIKIKAEKSDERHRQQCMNKTVHSSAIILYTCQETSFKVYS